jgi:hypothetical protein
MTPTERSTLLRELAEPEARAELRRRMDEHVRENAARERCWDCGEVLPKTSASARRTYCDKRCASRAYHRNKTAGA